MRFLYSLLVIIGLLGGRATSAQAQTLDAGFAAGLTSFGGSIEAAVKQPDGKVILSGDFHLLNGQATARVVRLNADGTPDLAFRAQVGSGPDGAISAIALQADGKILLGAEQGLSYFNGQPAQSLVRLNPDGSRDATFGAGGTLWEAGFIGSIAVQADGKILVGGASSSTFNGQPIKGLVRLLPSGLPDASFNIGTGVALGSGGGFIKKLLVQPDGAILAGGQFSTFNGQARPLLVRLLPSGSVDGSFASLAPATTSNGYLGDLARQPDGKLVLGGSNLTGNSSTATDLIRLLPSGAPDPAFTSNVDGNGYVASVGVRADGSLLVGGIFTAFGGSPRGGLVRLSSTGAVDPAFATGGGTYGYIPALVELNNGQYLAGGGFSEFDGQPATGLVRLSSTGLLDASYAAQLYFVVNAQLTPLNSGQLLVNGPFTTAGGQAVGYPTGTAPRFILLNANSTYNSQPVLPAPLALANNRTYYNDVVPQPDGTYFATYQNTDTTTLVRRILANGTFDPAYAAVELQFGTAYPYPFCCAGVSFTPTPGGQVLVRGGFGRVNGQPRRYLARLNADGTLNTTFAPPTNAVWQVPNVGTGTPNGIRNVYGLANNQTLVHWNDAVRSYLTRLNADGSIDNTFSIGTGGGTNALFTVLPLASGKLLVMGSFTTFNGQAAPYGVVRLLASGAPDATFVAASPATNAVEQPDGKLVAIAPGATVQSQRLLRLTPTGSLDAGFQPLLVANESYRQAAARVYLQPGTNALLLAGDFTSVGGQPRFGLARVVNTALAVRGAAALAPVDAFPNPTHDQLQLRLPTPATGPLTLLDLQGRVVRRWPAAQAAGGVSVAGLAPGVYVLGIPLAAGQRWQRLVVE
ncbi:hypothetical protein GCM10028824_20510 [Hymenobacter segetis]|uniref:T9SS type A sorting domain-containing protein n=1 Tax=Hymenobacter segetis TaxID=2025509 RepID=A0ABU9LRE4_9BACT